MIHYTSKKNYHPPRAKADPSGQPITPQNNKKATEPRDLFKIKYNLRYELHQLLGVFYRSRDIVKLRKGAQFNWFLFTSTTTARRKGNTTSNGGQHDKDTKCFHNIVKRDE